MADKSVKHETAIKNDNSVANIPSAETQEEEKREPRNEMNVDNKDGGPEDTQSCASSDSDEDDEIVIDDSGDNVGDADNRVGEDVDGKLSEDQIQDTKEEIEVPKKKKKNKKLRREKKELKKKKKEQERIEKAKENNLSKEQNKNRKGIKKEKGRQSEGDEELSNEKFLEIVDSLETPDNAKSRNQEQEEKGKEADNKTKIAKEIGKEGVKDDQQFQQQEDINQSKTDSTDGNDVLDASPSNTNEPVSSDAMIDRKSGQEDKSSTTGMSKEPKSPTHNRNDEERNEEQPMDITEDHWDQECENGDQKQVDNLKKNGGVNREVVYPELQNRGEESPSLLSRVVSGAKSIFGFPSNQERQFYFYVDVQVPANAVYLQIFNKSIWKEVEYRPMESIDTSRRYWRIRAFCLPKNFTFYYYVVHPGNQVPIHDFDKKYMNKRRMDNLRSHYSVFRYTNYNNDYSTGLFWFARDVYSKMCTGQLTLKDSLDEYDQIEFGCIKFPRHERGKVADWIERGLIQEGTTLENALFFAHVIQHFDGRLLYNTKNNSPLLKDLIHNDSCITTLLNAIHQCSKDDLYLIPDVAGLVASLLCKIQSGKSLEMFVVFVFHVGMTLIAKLSYLQFHWNEEEISFLKSEEIYSILKNPQSEKDRNRVLGFIVKRAPSISAIFELQEFLNNACPSYVTSSAELFKKTCNNLISSKQASKTSWPTIPQKLKSDFVEPYIKALCAEIKPLYQINVQQEDALKVFFTDETALESEAVKKAFLEICKSPITSKVVIDILQDSTFNATCWKDASEDFKKEVYQCILNFAPQRHQQENHVLKSFQDLDRVFFALDVCPFDGIKQTATDKCHKAVSTEELKIMADAYEQVQELHADVRDQYFVCLQRSIENEVKKDHIHKNIIALLKELPVEDEKEKSKVERITKETLRCLCQELKIPSEAKDVEKQGFEKVFQDVLKNIPLWSALLDAWPPWQSFEEFPQTVLLMKVLDLLEQALKDENITIRDLKSLGNKNDAVDVLHKMHSVFSNQNLRSQSSLIGLVTTCLEKESDVFQRFEQLLKAVRFVKQETDRIVDVVDIDDILEDLRSKKSSFQDTSLSEVLDKYYWRSAKPFLDRMNDLQDLMQFQVLRNAAIDRLEEAYETSSSGSEDEYSSGTSKDVLKVLIDRGVFYVNKLCEPLFEDVGSMPIKHAKIILKEVGEKTLDSELNFIQRSANNQKFAVDVKTVLLRFLNFPQMRENLQALDKLLQSMDLCFQEEIIEFFTNTKECYENLQQLYDATEKVIDIEDSLHGPRGEVVKELAGSKELIKLLQDTADDDVRNLIDAVEEHSDTTVAAKEVSDFIEIHKFFSPVFRTQGSQFFVVLRRRLLSLTEPEAIAIAARIKASSHNAHSLRNVYKNVANRGEMTKEIVDAALRKGQFKISNAKICDPDEGSKITRERWEYSVTYSDEGNNITHSMESLQDIKSRALLIVNSEKKQLSSSEKEVDYQRFIDQIDLLNEIVNTGEDLQQSGHPDFEDFWRECHSFDEIQTTSKELNEERQRWERTVREARDSNFYLNFFHPKQVWTLKEFFKCNSSLSVTQEALALLRFVDGSVTMKTIAHFVNDQKIKDSPDFKEQFRQIGDCLENFFGSSSGRLQKRTEVDTKRGLSVAVLEKDSTQTAAIVMKLFKDLPLQPNKVLFCHENSTWDEIELFLRRSFTPQSYNVPHCLANVESLDTDLQFQLIDAIRGFQAKVSQYWLVLICRGGEHHHIVNQFRECAKKVEAMTDRELRSAFSTKFPDVSMVTSDLPGLGKTELIYQEAARKRKRLVCFPINGPVERHKLVHRLSRLGLDEDSLLHIDVSEVDDPLFVDSFLFELIVLGMVSSSTLVFHLPTFFIAIEVANTLQHHLRDSLAVTKCFLRIHEDWKDFQNFVCSEENESAIQVVCQYLNAYEKKSLETETLSSRDMKEATPLSENECRRLLKKHSPWCDLSFNTLEIFLNVLAAQLRRFSSSPFFRPEHLKAALKETGDIRVQLFEALKNVSIEFAKRSVEACKEVQTLALWQNVLNSRKDTANKMVHRVDGMVRWAEDNHLVVMFQEADSISALFRELEMVPKQVQELFKSQNAPLRDLGAISENDLEDKLRKILMVDSKNQRENDGQNYVLTPDNILKMVLIVQRIRARVPVIVMGETGCGKTSLVRYLAQCCSAKLSVMNFHAGIYEEDIVKFTEKQMKRAEEDPEKQVWVFFDEINTCDYLGLICDIICHRCLNGKELPPNIVFIAACNPYCLRSSDSITTAGLTGKSLTDEYSNLVYRVKPLPETMMDYVWDYGSLDPQDERVYIRCMVDKLHTSDSELVVDLLAISQQFIRQLQNRYSVSLRDVRRCILLAEWFKEMIAARPPIDDSKFSKKVRNVYIEAQRRHSIEDRSIILALAHSYQSRIPSSKGREDFRSKLEQVYRIHGKRISGTDIDNIVTAEQEEYLARMELPEGTARNTALRENVFVILVCILNRIPVFVVGKPGCSKSLSMQVIISNLRGKDSKDDFFKTLPQLLVVSYQGSESSTSEGILKVFDKAQKYKEQNKEDESLPVVLLDEVGLAEISKYNPLKVLHRLLEPEEKELPDVAVVGISNWALDAAKMNRAIHLSRPEPTLKDLEETGSSILEAQLESSSVLNEDALQGLNEDMLSCLARSYHEYQKEQKHDNFHGLRDYYSLIKCLSQTLMNKDSGPLATFQARSTFRSLQRNFGGLRKEDQGIEEIHIENVKSIELHHELDEREHLPVTDMIMDNLKDPFARHLMLITSGESALGIIDDTLAGMDKEKVVIYGSKFEEDQSEDYSYRTLSRIILHMERECVLVLRDLESVYGSLYDMLNQNYVVVGQKKNCRVALGPYSNPMCQVHDGFRCIVLVDEGKVDYTDPPFLNRFEKQLLRYSDVLGHREMEVISQLKEWVNNFCSIEDNDFSDRDVFLGLQDDTLASLVLLLSRQNDPTSSDLLRRCKEKLLDIATPDGVLRSLCSNQYKKDPQEVKALYDNYFFEKPLHKGLKGFIKSFNGEGSTNSILKYLVVTHSSIHTDVAKCLEGLFTCQVEKLGSYKSERQLLKNIQQFWQDSSKDLLVFQCKPNLDAEHMLLMTSTSEKCHENYLMRCSNEGKSPTKSICVIVHLQRGKPSEKSKPWQFSFLNSWKQATIDALEEPDVQVTAILGQTVVSLMKENTLSLKKIMTEKLMWCFTRLKYPQYSPIDQDSVHDHVANMTSTGPMMKYLKKIVIRWITNHHDNQEDRYQSSSLRVCDWQVKVACDKNALLGSSTLSSALLRYIDNLVRRPLAKAIFLIEDRLSFECCQRVLNKARDKTDTQIFLADLITDENLFNIDDIPDPHEPHCYVLTKPGLISSLNFPFSLIFNGKIDSLRDRYLAKSKGPDFVQDLHDDIRDSVPQLFSTGWMNDNMEEYIEDVFDFASAKFSSDLSREQRIKILKAACANHLIHLTGCDDDVVLAQIYIFLWKFESKFLAILQLFSSCKSFFAKDISRLTRNYIRAFEDAMPNVTNPAKSEVPFDVEKSTSVNEDGDYNDEEVSSGDDSDDGSDGAENNTDDSDDDSDGDDSTDDDDDDDNDSGSDSDDDSDDSNDDDDDNDDIDDNSEDDDEGDQDNEVDNGSDRDDNTRDEGESSCYKAEETGNQEQAGDAVNDKTPFLENFFNALCETLLPNEDLISKLGGPKNWQTTANTFISLVAKSDLQETPLYIYLRICSDFTNMVLDPHNLQNPNSLYMLSELCHRGDHLGDLQNCFHELLDVIDNMESQSREAEKFKMSFLSRCLQSCETEEFFKDIVTTVSSLTDKETLQMASPLVCNIIQYTLCMLDCEGFDFNYLDLLEGRASDSAFIQVLDEALHASITKADGTTDCHFVTVCLDAINKLMPGTDIPDPSEVCNSSSETMSCLKTAVAIVKEPRGKQSIFGLLIAIAYLRSFMSSLAEMIHENPSFLKRESEYSNLFVYLNSIFEIPMGSSTKSPRKASSLLYFLKELKGYYSVYELRQICEEASQLSILRCLPWEDQLSTTPFHVLKESILKTTTKKALRQLIVSSDVSAVQDICNRLPSDANLRKVFAVVLMEDLYLLPSHVDTVDKAADTIVHLLPRTLSDPYQRFILCLTGKEDIKTLRVSHERSIRSSKQTTIVLHLLAILTAEHNPKYMASRPFVSYFLDPLKAAEGCVLANPDSSNQEPTKLSHAFTCLCGTAFVRNDEQTSCPQRRKLCSTLPDSAGSIRRDLKRDLSLCVADTTEDEFSVCNMTPSSFRLLHLLVHSALYAGVSLEMFPRQALTQFLSMDDGTGSPVERCSKEIDNDLRVLQRLWGCGEEQMVSTVHQLMEDLSGLVTKPTGALFLTDTSRRQWQKDFSQKVEQLLQRQTETVVDANLTSLEAQIEEKDSTDDSDVEKRNNWVPRLFRSTKEATLDDLCSKYHCSTHSDKKKHSLIALFLKYIKILPKAAHLYPLIRFSNMLERRFGRRLSRAKANKYIGDVIKEDSVHYKELKDALDAFCSSWEVVRSDIKRELGEDVPHLSETSPTSYFLVDPDSGGRFMHAAIRVLQGIQNEFQGEVLHLALEGTCKALDFLKKSDASCTMPFVHVQDVMEEEIICFEWDDSILLHSYHRNTDYGRGNEIFYDFDKIERELAGRFLMKRVYLGTTGDLMCFPYSNELFHTCSNVLNDVCLRMPQESIDANMQNRLNVLKDKSLESVQDLLEHLEVIICWLAKASHLDPEMALVDYVKRKLPKSNLLPETLFQDAKKEFKVCHVVSMYQKLEEVFSVFAAENVGDTYRRALSEEMTDRLKKVTDNLGADNIDELTIVLTALRRFIFRYLLSDLDDQWSRDPRENVVSQLDDPSLWSLTVTSHTGDVSKDQSTPVFKQLISKFVPQLMLAAEVYSVMTFYDTFVKTREKKKQLAKRAGRKTRAKMAPNFKSRFA